MTVEKTEKLINEIFNEENPAEIGILLSLLSYNFIKKYNVPEKTFIKSLKNSLKICKKENY